MIRRLAAAAALALLCPTASAAPGILNIAGNLTLGPGTILNFEIGGTTPGPTGHDQVVVGGILTINGTLNIIPFGGFVPAGGDVFELFRVTSANPVVGILPGLPEGTVFTRAGWTFRISYVAGDGNEVTITALTAPAAPTIGVATPGNGQATIAFTPGSNGGSPVTGYTVTCNPGPFTQTALATSIAIPGLANGTAYTCSVTATNAFGTSPSSGTVSVTPRTTPGAPAITGVTPGNQQATVTFTAPASDGGSAITGYTANCGGITATGPGPSIVVGGLVNGTPYTCTVLATNAAGNGPLSAPSASVTPVAVPGAPTIVAATPGNAQASIAFTPPASNGGSAITSYTLTCNPGPLTASGPASPLALTGLANGSTYTCSVTATNAVGTGVASAPVTVTPTQNTFSGPSATGTGTITASFSGGGAGCTFNAPAFIGPPPGSAPVPPTAVPGVAFPHGLFDFRTTGCTAGSTVTFTLTYPATLPPNTQYWKYGPTPGNATPRWYLLPAAIAGATATFTITDGGLGDDDLTANGTIVDQGGPGVPIFVTPEQVPTLSQWAMLLMTLLMAMGGALALRGRNR